MRFVPKHFAVAVICGVALAGVAAQAQCTGAMAGGDSAANPPKVVRMSAGIMQGQLLSHVAPIYPPGIKTESVQGTVVLQAIIGKEGTVEELRVVSGPALLQGAALDAVKQWQYRPFLLNGEPTEVETTVLVNFHPPPADAQP